MLIFSDWLLTFEQYYTLLSKIRENFIKLTRENHLYKVKVHTSLMKSGKKRKTAKSTNYS